MKTLYYPIDHRSFRISGLFRKYILFLSLCLLYTTALEAMQEQKHHVVLLIDRSAGMQPERDEKTFKNLFDELDNICFSAIDSSIGRPLLQQETGDYLSIVTFGLKHLNNNFINYTQEGREFNHRYYSYGGLYNNHFHRDIIRDLKHMIFNEIRYYNFFDVPFAYPSYSVPLVLKEIADKREEELFSRLFIIRISDRKLNSENSLEDELSNAADLLNTKEAYDIRDQLKTFFDYDKQIYSLCRSYARRTPVNSRSLDEKGANYYIDTYEITPKRMVTISNVFKLPYEVHLKRGKNCYTSEFNIIQVENPHLSPDTLFVDYSLNNHIIQQDTVSPINTDMYPKTIYLDRKAHSINKGDTLLVHLSLIGKYKNDFIKGLQLNESLYPGLATSFKGIFEEDAMLFGKPIDDSLICFNDQHLSAGIIKTLSYLFLAGIFIYFIRLYIKRKPYPVKNEQFELTRK